MKKPYFLLAAVLFFVSSEAQIINFPDANFKFRLMLSSPNNSIAINQSGASIRIDSNNDNQIDVVEAQAVYRLNLQDATIADMEGLNYFINLRVLEAAYNYFSNLDVSSLLYLDTLDVANNPDLMYLNIKNGLLGFNIPPPPPIPSGLGDATFTNCPSLHYVCCDEDKIEEGNSYLIQNGLINITINDYCTFAPGGAFCMITGNSKLDMGADGCDTFDNTFPYLKLIVNNGAFVSNFITNAIGNYTLAFPSGAYTLTPELENPSYFSVSPQSVLVDIQTVSSTFTQNFCVTPIGNHPDLEVTILPLGVARPGFDAYYRIGYKNKGNQLQSGTISLIFNDAVLDLVNANPAVTSQVMNNLNWTFTNLLPFETRQISIVLNVNSPIDVLPVNGGDILNFNSSVSSSSTDETPTDNTFTLNQTVVNSFDPNDKTCLEGNTITPQMVGKELHYLIRFENTGTTNAENIVVKDIIDTTKFDISSLIPIDGSHPFVTRISNTNKVEFIFENIQLPFDDANNDGYVAFKIKTKPTLVVGNSFSNTASIYFDYNFPIITNTATTTVALLANVDFAFEDYFKIYPNPANDVLNIETKQTIEVTSINIYNTLGQIVLVIPNAQQTKSVDVSGLKSGNYFMKINSNRGMSNSRFVKN